MNDMLFPAIMAAAVLASAACLIITPLLGPNGVVLGVRVPRSRLGDPAVAAAVRSYRATVAAAGLMLTAAVALWWESAAVVILAPLVLTLAAGVSFAVHHNRIADAKREGRWFAGVDTTVTGRVAGIGGEAVGFPWAPFVAALAVPVLGGLYALARWEDIPEVFPMHYGPDFQPDAWGEKSAGAALFGMWFALGLVALMAIVARITVSQRVHTRSDRTVSGRENQREVMRESARGVAWVSLAVAVGLTVLQLASVFPEFQPHMPAVIIAFLVATLGAAGVMVARIAWVRSRFRRADGAGEVAESPDNDRHYVWGLFYANPDDPAVLVDKRAGAGFDLNYATWQGKVFLAALALVIASTVALPLVL